MEKASFTPRNPSLPAPLSQAIDVESPISCVSLPETLISHPIHTVFLYTSYSTINTLSAPWVSVSNKSIHTELLHFLKPAWHLMARMCNSSYLLL